MKRGLRYKPLVLYSAAVRSKISQWVTWPKSWPKSLNHYKDCLECHREDYHDRQGKQSQRLFLMYCNVLFWVSRDSDSEKGGRITPGPLMELILFKKIDASLSTPRQKTLNFEFCYPGPPGNWGNGWAPVISLGASGVTPSWVITFQNAEAQYSAQYCSILVNQTIFKWTLIVAVLDHLQDKRRWTALNFDSPWLGFANWLFSYQ